MVSIGKEAYVTKLVADEIQVTGVVNSSHKVIGAAKNEGELHHKGSIFYCKFSNVHQVDEADTTTGQASITYTVASAHDLSVGDTVRLGTQFSGTAVDGIPVTELIGLKTVSAVPSSTKFTVSTTTAANSTDTHAQTPLLRIDRYKYIDLNTNASTWSSSTSEPSPSHTNSETFYL